MWAKQCHVYHPKMGMRSKKKNSYIFMVIFLGDGKHGIVLPTLTISFISTKIYKGSLVPEPARMIPSASSTTLGASAVRAAQRSL